MSAGKKTGKNRTKDCSEQDREEDYAKFLEKNLTLFRQAQNLFLQIPQHLQALGNINKQKNVLLAAMRRQRTSSGDSSVKAVTPPLGVLQLFTVYSNANIELLIAQHQKDETALLNAFSLREGEFKKKMNDMEKLVDEFEDAMLNHNDTAAAANTKNSSSSVFSSYDDYYSTFYATSNSATSTSPQQQQTTMIGYSEDDAFRHRLHQLQCNLLSVLTEMSSTLQEAVFTLRRALLADSLARGPSVATDDDHSERRNNSDRINAVIHEDSFSKKGEIILHNFIQSQGGNPHHSFSLKSNTYGKGALGLQPFSLMGNENNKVEAERTERIHFMLTNAENEKDGSDSLSDSILALKDFLEFKWDCLKNDLLTDDTIITLSA